MLQNPNKKLDGRSETDGPRIFVRSRSVVSRRVSGEALIVPVRGKLGDLAPIYSFNEVASLILQFLGMQRDLSELVYAVWRENDFDPAPARRGVSEFLKE